MTIKPSPQGGGQPGRGPIKALESPSSPQGGGQPYGWEAWHIDPIFSTGWRSFGLKQFPGPPARGLQVDPVAVAIRAVELLDKPFDLPELEAVAITWIAPAFTDRLAHRVIDGHFRFSSCTLMI